MVNDIQAGLAELFSGGVKARGVQQMPLLTEGIVGEVSDGSATFSVPEFGATAVFGPAPFGSTADPPLTGDTCLVAFVAGDVGRAWILSWTSPG